ncbi:MAG: ATP-binding protein [Bacteroidales bacterium]|nr:ATP-binding protein [Bacteroidales bacterium]
MKSIIHNPFVEYGYKGAQYFCDREKETKEIITDLQGESNVALISPRRIGKSGLIMHVFDEIKKLEPETVCVYIDILNTRDINQFINLFASRIIGSLDSLSQSLMRKVVKFFGSVSPVLSFDELSGTPQLSFTIQPNQQRQTLENVFRYIADSKRRCYIAIDEFQQICEYPDGGLEPMLRSFIQFVPNAVFIFSGSEQHLMEEMFLSAKRPFYLSSHITALGVIDEAKYLAFANGFFAKQKRKMDPDVFHGLYQLVDGQTWYVQSVLHQLYEMDDQPLDGDLVRMAVDYIIGRMDVAYSNYYASLTDNQAALLRAIAKEKCVKAPLRQEFLLKYSLPAASSVRLSLKSLEKRQMVYSLPNRGYVVYDRFVAIWLCRL